MHIRRAVIAIGGAVAIACGNGVTGPPPPPPPPAITGNHVLVGAGDIAVCGSLATEQTAALLDRIDGTVFTAGDNAYFQGSAANFLNCYEPTWGRHKQRTRPAPGNHEYETPGAAAYFAYFGPNAGPPGLGYYSFEAGAWHVVSLNSSVPASLGSPQYQWLAGDLADRNARCVAAIWHHPMFSSGPNGPSSAMRDIWQLLQQARVEMVINGHEHVYERFVPLDANRRPNPDGLRQFIVGTGGAELYNFVAVSPDSEVRLSTFGILKLNLTGEGYRWEFLGTNGNVLDSGTGLCH
jgi:calcineurin-like phosphoesterase family protein